MNCLQGGEVAACRRLRGDRAGLAGAGVVLWTVICFAGASDALRAEEPCVPQGRAQVEVRVDPRVELMSVVFRLAGYSEYNQCRLREYQEDVEGWFGRFRDHRAVALARELREKRHVGYDACMSLAVHVEAPPALTERVGFDERPSALDARWRIEEAREFLAEVRRLAEESEFERFFEAHEALYGETEARLRKRVETEGHLEWFDEFFGPREECRFVIIAALLNGPSNYGPSCRLADGKEEYYCILGAWRGDEAGKPLYGPEVLATVVHEFCHSYCNPIIDAHEEELREPGELLFGEVSAAMGRQAYGHWKTMMYESLVRACTIRHIKRYRGLLAAAWQRLDEQGRQFRWVGGLADLLADYEKRREEYPTLDRFAPKLVDYFKEQSRVLKR